MQELIASNVHIAGRGVYIPTHRNASGKVVRAQYKVNAFLTDNFFKKTGDTKKGQAVPLSFWGTNANTAAHYMGPGKQLILMKGRLTPYKGRVFHNQVVVVAPDGSGPLMVPKMGIEITFFEFGKDAQNLAKQEVLEAKRPANWDDHAEGAAAWRAYQSQKKNMHYDGTSGTFGYGDVKIPNYPGVVYDPALARDPNPKVAPMPSSNGYAAPIAAPFANAAGSPRAVAAALPVQGPWAPQPAPVMAVHAAAAVNTGGPTFF